MGVVEVLELIQPRQLALRVPAQRPFVAVPVVDVDFNVVGAGAARGDEETARVAADFGGRGPEGRVSEADVEEAGRGEGEGEFIFPLKGDWGLEGGGLCTHKRATALRYG